MLSEAEWAAIWPTISNPALEKDHPMEHCSIYLQNTEPQPAYFELYGSSDLLYGHCIIHCSHHRCKATYQRAAERAHLSNTAVKFKCSCARRKLRAPLADIPPSGYPNNKTARRKENADGPFHHRGPAFETHITPDTELTAAEVSAVETFSVDKPLLITHSTWQTFAPVFAAEIVPADTLAQWPRSTHSRAHLIATRQIALARQILITQLSSYFRLTLSQQLPVDSQSRHVSLRTLKSEITAYLGPALLLWCSKAHKQFVEFADPDFDGYEPECVTTMLDNYPAANAVWRFWDEKIEDLLKLFVLREIRGEAKGREGLVSGLLPLFEAHSVRES